MHLLILLAELSAIFNFLQSHIHRDLSAKITIFLIMQTIRCQFGSFNHNEWTQFEKWQAKN